MLFDLTTFRRQAKHACRSYDNEYIRSHESGQLLAHLHQYELLCARDLRIGFHPVRGFALEPFSTRFAHIALNNVAVNLELTAQFIVERLDALQVDDTLALTHVD